MLQALLGVFGVVAEGAIRSAFVRTFAGPVQKLSLQERRDDPVYKKNLQRLIEHNSQSEVSDPH